MAGNYPSAPSYRMALDKDGSTLVTIAPNNVITQRSAANLTAMSNESDDNLGTWLGGVGHSVAVIFPEKRDLLGYFVACSRNNGLTLWVSTNTTNGLDGTWTQFATRSATGDDPVVPGYRTSIVSTSQLGIKAFKLTHVNGGWSEFDVRAIHLYGVLSAGENPNRLEIWHPTDDVRASSAYFDFAETPRNSQMTLLSRVKNLSPTQTATGVTLSTDVLTDATPSLSTQYQVSLDGVTYSNSISLGNIAPGAMSPVFRVRRNTSATAALGLWSLRLKASPTSWS